MFLPLKEQTGEKTNNGTHYKLQLLYSNGEYFRTRSHHPPTVNARSPPSSSSLVPDQSDSARIVLEQCWFRPVEWKGLMVELQRRAGVCLRHKTLLIIITKIWAELMAILDWAFPVHVTWSHDSPLSSESLRFSLSAAVQSSVCSWNPGRADAFLSRSLREAR